MPGVRGCPPLVSAPLPDQLAAVVLAAGAGTRLRPLTELRPKALCPVGLAPLVDHAIERAAHRAGAVAVNAHHGAARFVAHLEARPVHISVEAPVALGTAGGVAALRGWIDGRDVLVVNADGWHPDDDLGPLVDAWDRERVRLLVLRDELQADFGAWRYVGACLLPWSDVAQLRPEPTGLYEVLWRRLSEDGRLEFVEGADGQIDCGTPSDYLAANLQAADAAGGVIVGEGASITGRVARAVIGAGARVDGDVEASVVWPGEHVDESERLRHAVRAGGRTLQVAPACPAPEGVLPTGPVQRADEAGTGASR